MTRLHPELSGLLDQIEANRAGMRKLTAGLSEAQFQWRPAAGVWSAGDEAVCTPVRTSTAGSRAVCPESRRPAQAEVQRAAVGPATKVERAAKSS